MHPLRRGDVIIHAKWLLGFILKVQTFQMIKPQSETLKF